MAIETDVLVIGGGLAGTTAALAAAEEGAQVRLLSANQSTLRQASGLIDVLGYPPRAPVEPRAAVDPGATSEAPGGNPPEEGPPSDLGSAGEDDPRESDASEEVPRDDQRAAGGERATGESGGDPAGEPAGEPDGESDGEPAGAPDGAPGGASNGQQTGDYGRPIAEPSSDDAGPIADPFDAIPDLPEGHPYERVGVDAVREGLELFDRVVDAYAGGHTDANALVPTAGGTVKPTARYPEQCAHGLASDERDALLVGFDSVTGFEPQLAADHLRAAGVPFDVEGVTVQFPGDLRADAGVNRYAQLFDADEVPGRESEPVSGRAAVAERIQRGIEDAAIEPERIGLPAILGEEVPGAVRAGLEDRLGLPAFEVPTGAPSVPGLRLEQELYDAAMARDVRTSVGRPVVDYDADDGRIDTVDVQHSDSGTVPHGAEQVVLATGGLVGRGIDTARETVEEPIFDCHVPHPADRYDWFADEVFGAHPFPRFGVAVDRELRPQTADGEPEFANLRAAGSVLGGYDFAAEKSGAGVSIATGYAAGTAAAEEV